MNIEKSSSAIQTIEPFSDLSNSIDSKSHVKVSRPVSSGKNSIKKPQYYRFRSTATFKDEGLQQQKLFIVRKFHYPKSALINLDFLGALSRPPLLIFVNKSVLSFLLLVNAKTLLPIKRIGIPGVVSNEAKFTLSPWNLVYYNSKNSFFSIDLNGKRRKELFAISEAPDIVDYTLIPNKKWIGYISTTNAKIILISALDGSKQGVLGKGNEKPRRIEYVHDMDLLGVLVGVKQQKLMLYSVGDFSLVTAIKLSTESIENIRNHGLTIKFFLQQKLFSFASSLIPVECFNTNNQQKFFFDFDHEVKTKKEKRVLRSGMQLSKNLESILLLDEEGMPVIFDPKQGSMNELSADNCKDIEFCLKEIYQIEDGILAYSSAVGKFCVICVKSIEIPLMCIPIVCLR